MKDVIDLKLGKENTKIDCLDKGFVQLVDCMPRLIHDNEDSADYTIAEAARCSYQRGTKTIRDDKGLIRYLMRHNHTSPFEMIEFKFHMKMPLYICTQLLRHRTASVNCLSARFSQLTDDYYIPDVSNIRIQSEINKQGSESNVDALKAIGINSIMNTMCEETYEAYIKLLNQGVAREQARGILPYCFYTELYWKMDLKNLLHFLNLRCDEHAQQEIRVYANAILDLIKPIIPYTIDAWEEYSEYRGGMKLTKTEINTLKELLKDVSKDDIPSIFNNKLEKKEWEDKLKKLGF